MDLAKTLSSVGGAELKEDTFVDSRDALKALVGEDATGRPHLVHEVRKGLALRVGQWKFIPAGPTRDELGPWKNTKIPKGGALYDLSTDLGEKKNLAAEKPEKLAEMKALLVKLRSGNDR